MTTFTESSTGLGIVLPEAAHTSWEGIAWQNQHLSGWVASAQNRSTRLLTGTLANDQLTGLEVNWVLEDGRVLRRQCADHALTYAPGERKVLYLDFDQMDPTEPSKQAVLEMTLPLFANFHPSEKLFPLVHFGQYQETSTAATDFAFWLAPKDLQGISAQVMPVGTVLMYDGGSWVDDITMKGWYACIGGSVPNDGRPGAGTAIPDLRDRFIKGCSAGQATGVLGGTHAIPEHSHSVSGHHHGNFLSIAAHNEHSHNIASHFHYADGAYAWGLRTPTSSSHVSGGSGQDYNHYFSGWIGNQSGPSGDNPINTSTAGAADNKPAFYTTIFIQRIS